MCGICGVAPADPRAVVDPETLARMTATLRHRGPDGAGVHLGAGVGLGVRRLAVVDVETGDQPLVNEDGTVVVACNGEIYNAPELRRGLVTAGHRFRSRSDVEVIAHLYEAHDVGCLEHLRGMFGLAVWDARRRRLLLARDRLGIKPLHFAERPEGLYFGSEMKAILAADAVSRDPDLAALAELFDLGFVQAPRTLLAPIRALLPGHYLLYEAGALAIHRYWRLRFPPAGQAAAGSPRAWSEALRAKLEETVRLHLRSDVPVGAYLSPGVDSSGVTSLARRLAGGPVPTFTLGFEDRAYDEAGRRPTLDRFPGPTLSNERVTCERTALGRYPRALWHCETPSASGLEVPQLVLAEAASRRVRVVLTGEGADELFGGYAWFRLDRALRRLGRLPLTLRRLALRVGPVAAWRPRATLLLDPPDMTPARYARLMGWLPPGAGARVWSRDLAARLGPDHEERAPSPGAADEDGWHPFARLQFLEMTMRLPNLITRILDGASMAHGVEARVPFLDHELVELAAWIPPRLKLRGRTEKYVLRRALQEDLPRAIRRRRKRGLGTPYREWLRAALPSYAEELLSPGRLRDKGYFDPARVATLLARHRAGHAGGGPVLLAVLAVQVWDELFVRGRGPFDG